MDQQISTFNPCVELSHGKLVTNSMNVALVFEKRHKYVLDVIKGMDMPDDFRGPNFRPTSYTDTQNKKRPMYELTRDGFTLLAMGFTGRPALRFKLAYINAFTAMESELISAPAQVAALKRQLAKELLKQRPLWQKIKRYRELGLTLPETGTLVGLKRNSVRKHIREMEACGLLTPPANIATMRQGMLCMNGGASHV